MATPNTPPLEVPGNLKGTLAGLAASVAVGMLAKAGYLAIAATFLGMPEATVSAVAIMLVGAGANFVVTHYSGLKTLNSIYTALPEIHTYAEYPGDAPQPLVNTNLVTKTGDTVS